MGFAVGPTQDQDAGRDEHERRQRQHAHVRQQGQRTLASQQGPPQPLQGIGLRQQQRKLLQGRRQ